MDACMLTRSHASRFAGDYLFEIVLPLLHKNEKVVSKSRRGDHGRGAG
jgi:hypothetical protein